MKPLFLQVAFNGKSRQFTVNGLHITLGSAPDCTLVLPFHWVAAKHIEIEHGLLLSRVRCAAEQCVATLDGYPLTADWSILPHNGLIEIVSPLGGKLAIAVDLEAVPVAAVAPATVAAAASSILSGPINVTLRTHRRPTASGGLLMKYVPLAIAALLLLGVVAVLFIVNSQTPSGRAPLEVAPPPTSSPATNPVEETPATEPATLPIAPASAPAPEPVVVAPPPPPPPEPPPPEFTRRKVDEVTTTGPFEYLDQEHETRDALDHPTTRPLKSDLLRVGAYEQAKLAVQSLLKGANAVTFPDLDSGQVVVDFHDGAYVARGAFESTNADGVPIRQEFYCKLRPTSGDRWEIERTDIFSR